MNTLRNIAAFVAAFLVGSITNAIQLGTPMWLTVTDALGYLPVALVTGKWMTRA